MTILSSLVSRFVVTPWIYILSIYSHALVDAYDVVFLEPARALIEKFESFCAHIVMNSELAIAPDASMLSVLPEPPASHALPYLNCGAFMGQARYIRLMLEGIKADIAANYEIDTQITSSEDWMTVNDQRCVVARLPCMLVFDTFLILRVLR